MPHFLKAQATANRSSTACAGTTTRPGARAPWQASGAVCARFTSSATNLCLTRSLSKELPSESTSSR
eukprot:15447535-Alexandrium_andersonii.AAC.1